MKKYCSNSSLLEMIGIASFILLNFAGVLAIAKYLVFSSIVEELIKGLQNKDVLSWELATLLSVYLLCITFLCAFIIWVWYKLKKEKMKIEYQDRKIIKAVYSYADDNKNSGKSIIIRARVHRND